MRTGTGSPGAIQRSGGLTSVSTDMKAGDSAFISDQRAGLGHASAGRSPGRFSSFLPKSRLVGTSATRFATFGLDRGGLDWTASAREFNFLFYFESPTADEAEVGLGSGHHHGGGGGVKAAAAAATEGPVSLRNKNPLSRYLSNRLCLPGDGGLTSLPVHV